MSVVGTTRVTCPACGREQDCRLVQSINAVKEPAAKQQLLLGELNVLACDCGRRTQLAANVVYADPDKDYLAQVVPGGEADMATAARRFAAAGGTGTRRLVPSLNALIEKLKILEAGLEDWAVEMAKLLLLASTPEADLDRVLLFERVEDATIHWLLFDEVDGPQIVSSTLAAYERLVARAASRPKPSELRIDRAWAVDAVQSMITATN